MGYLALALAAIAAPCVAAPSPGLFIGAGIAIAAAAVGRVSYRERKAPAWNRLCGAAALGVGGTTLAVATTKFALTVYAVKQLPGLLL